MIFSRGFNLALLLHLLGAFCVGLLGMLFIYILQFLVNLI